MNPSVCWVRLKVWFGYVYWVGRRYSIPLLCSVVLTLSFMVIIYDFSLGDPLHITFEVFIQLLGLSQLLKLTSGLGFLSFFGELTSDKEDQRKISENSDKGQSPKEIIEKCSYPLSTPRTRLSTK